MCRIGSAITIPYGIDHVRFQSRVGNDPMIHVSFTTGRTGEGLIAKRFHSQMSDR